MRSFLSFALLSLFWALPAQSEVRPFGVELSLYGGVWEGDDLLETAALFGGRAQFHLNQVLGLELDYGMIPTQEKDEGDKTLGQFALSAILNLSDQNFSPFLVVGIGAVSADESYLAYDVGLGFKYYFNELVAARADFRGWFSSEAPAADEYAHFTATLGASFQLGGEDDVDGDGIKNRVDGCPNKAEDKDSFKDDDGCPDLDNDEDEVPDEKDKCPLKAEDKDGDRDEDGCPDVDDDSDGVENDKDNCPAAPEDKDNFKDEDGCPDPDNDQDGILDSQDKCPDSAESKNGVKDEDGCPEKDSDGDGFFDVDDKCPLKKENKNHFEDEDGCPDLVPQGIKAWLGPLKVFRFAGRSARIGPAHKKALKEIAQLMIQTPSLKIMIGGSAKGDAPEKVALERAEVIKAYLLKAGVKAAQLQVRSLGSAPVPEGAPKGVRVDRVELSLP